MRMRPYLSRIHAVAGMLAFVVIASFMLSSLTAELMGDQSAIAGVKEAIAWGLLALVPALAATGASGYIMTRRPAKGLPAAKLSRMKLIGANGILVLVPAALFLAWKAGRGEFDVAFAVVQALEFAVGSVNITLMGLNIRDGLRLSGRLRRSGPRTVKA